MQSDFQARLYVTEEVLVHPGPGTKSLREKRGRREERREREKTEKEKKRKLILRTDQWM